MRELLAQGYILDVFTWNELVQALAKRGRIEDAFNICEEYLMPGFPGWRDLHPNYIRFDRKGYKWMELRNYDIKRDKIIPRYKTLVVLAAALRDVRRDERNGIGYVKEVEAWQAEILEQAAPNVCRAISSMPRTNDPLQVEYLHGEMN
jgi:pentatricopeptide repeat-containing protein PET309